MECTCNWHRNQDTDVSLIGVECPIHGIFEAPICMTCRDRMVIYQCTDDDPVSMVELVECPDCAVQEDE